MRFAWAAAFAALILGCTIAADAAGLTIADGWSRPANTGDVGVVYLTIVNGGSIPDAMIAAKSPIAHVVEMHESTAESAPMPAMSGMSGMAGMKMGSAEGMHEVGSIPVPAHGRTQLAPGEFHLMLIGLRQPLKAGMTFPIQLDFRHAGWTTLKVHVHAMG